MKRNIFILCEGPDNTGKSTLINNIKQHFNQYTLHALHYSNVKQNTPELVQQYSKKMYTEMFQQMINVTLSDKSGIICDRSHLGEMVYGPMYRGYSGEYVLDIEKNFIYFKSFWDNLFLFTLYDSPERLIKRDDALSFTTDLDKKKVEIQNFLNAHEKSNIKHKKLINIEHHNAEQAIQAVVDFIESTTNYNA